MTVAVTYLHHNCFIIELGDDCFLVDYPALEQRASRVEPRALELLSGREVTFIFTHSHADHCGADVLKIAERCRRARFLLSYDVPELVPDLDLEGALVVDPDDGVVELEELRVEAIDATDLGVGFLIEHPVAKIWIGGDVAEWAWEAQDERAKQAERAYFDECVERVRLFAPDMALTNADFRLEATLAGAEKLVDAVRPPLFVPMHLFGDTSRMAELEQRLARPGVAVFGYRELGDRFEMEF